MARFVRQAGLLLGHRSHLSVGTPRTLPASLRFSARPLVSRGLFSTHTPPAASSSSSSSSSASAPALGGGIPSSGATANSGPTEPPAAPPRNAAQMNNKLKGFTQAYLENGGCGTCLHGDSHLPCPHVDREALGEQVADTLDILRSFILDSSDLAAGKLNREFTFPTNVGQPGAFDDWEAFLTSRGFYNAHLTQTQRVLSRSLTFPATVAHLFSPNRTFECSSSLGDDALAELSSRASGAFNETKSVNICFVGARAEATLPNEAWSQLMYLYPDVSWNLMFVGPHLPEQIHATRLDIDLSDDPVAGAEAEAPAGQPAGGLGGFLRRLLTPRGGEHHQAAERRAALRLGTRSEAPVPGLARAPSGGMRMCLSYYSRLYHEIHDDMVLNDTIPDVYILFNSGVGHEVNRHTWRPSIERLLETTQPLVFTSLGLEDCENDIAAVQRIADGFEDYLAQQSLDSLPAEGDQLHSHHMDDGAPSVIDSLDRSVPAIEWLVQPQLNSFRALLCDANPYNPMEVIHPNWSLFAVSGR
ncbi:hypothetical protein H696_01623 [Fonticula alba]|uniref:Mitochondrial splicing suppressor 51-like C-terminal domain-containing protein n=1 Tax=Fonticula alba TaxID=691883 RepID=A0A058ZE73_FONAL|nr:hypothetical protein H696_01623 [Fonticula alba]KCV72223.1 hypothetical protein H696_01623 [Fonticula alba]|eukprot:XP_009493801.1 hypothetical protein H696_01623 [Fonticula alba]